MKDLYSLSSYDYDLPPKLIAQHPCTPRDHSRLMVIERATGNIQEWRFHELADRLKAHDSLIFNNTKVIPARLLGKRSNGGEAEIFLLRPLGGGLWETLARPGKKLQTGSIVKFENGLFCEILSTQPDGNKILQFNCPTDVDTQLEKQGCMPLPPYIKRNALEPEDLHRYQTVYASIAGALAAPTAGLHFTQELLDSLTKKGIDQTTITLHVGLGTFRPVQVEDIRTHAMHEEHFIITPEAALKLNKRPMNHLQICVGTTCCRALESASSLDGKISPGSYKTNIFIHPGYQFKYVRALLTNFHLPKSTLLMLVCAFAGYDLTMKAYQKAIQDEFRFFSYGDAMLIL